MSRFSQIVYLNLDTPAMEEGAPRKLLAGGAEATIA